MNEVRSYSLLDHVRSKEKSDLSRILFFANTILPGDGVSKFFDECAKEISGERVTGLILIYPNYMINLVESTENGLFRVCSYMTRAEQKICTISKYFPLEISDGVRFFEKWHARRIIHDFRTRGENEEIDVENFEQVTKIYRELMINLYFLFNELKVARTTSLACLTERLDKLGNLGDSRLPDEKIIGALVKSTWGESLENLMENYWNEIGCPMDMDDEIWPFPDNPPIGIIRNN